MNLTLSLLAMGGPAPGGSTGSPLSMPMLMVLIFGVFYFMTIKPQQRKEKERRAMLDEVKKGDRVLFAGGLIGEVDSVGEKTVRMRLTDNVKIDVARGSITNVLKDDADLDVDSGSAS